MMTNKKIREAVCQANIELKKSGLIIQSFGNVSGVDRKAGIVYIKPSGVDYSKLSPDNMVAVSLKTGEVIGGKLKPSTDTPSHLEIYRAFPEVGGVVHTHSIFATTLAQACLPLRCTGTTHSDFFRGSVPVTRDLKKSETIKDYEKNTGKVIVEAFKRIKPMEMPAVLVARHGPFTWGADAFEAVHNAEALELLAWIEINLLSMGKNSLKIPKHLLDKHFSRKHGARAYYGQK